MSGTGFLPSSDTNRYSLDDQKIVLTKLYRRHLLGAWVRSGGSLVMWILAFPPYLVGHLKMTNLLGITASVFYLILISLPLLAVARRLKNRRAFEHLTILVNFLEVLGYTAAIHFVGGLDAAFLLPIYCILIAYVGMLSPIRLTVLSGIFCLVFFDGMVLLEHYGILANYAMGYMGSQAFALPIAVKLTILAAVNGLLFEVTLICARIGGKLRNNRLHIRQQNLALKRAGNELERKVAERTTDLEQTNLSLRKEIEERKRSEDERAILHNQLRHAQKMEAVGSLTSGIAHDFNNILHALSGYVQLLTAENAQNYKSRKYLGDMDAVVNRAIDLVQRLMVFSHQAEPVLKPIDLNKQIGQTLEILEHTIPKMIDIRTRLSRDLQAVKADPGQVERILMNLCTNARDAMPEGGTLSVETGNVFLDDDFFKGMPGRHSGNYVHWTVSDTGQGMDEQTVQRIFDPFFTTKEIGRGTGLGMYTVYGIVKNLGGFITCHSRLGQGTAFQIYLPVFDGLALDFPQNALDAAGMELGGTETILLVDDETSVLEIGRDMLTDHGYTVITENCGEKALERYRQDGNSIDLIVLDLGMPGMGGRACLEEILKLDAMVKVIIASGYSKELHVNEVLESGARAFIPKPYRLTDMLRKIREILED